MLRSCIPKTGDALRETTGLTYPAILVKREELLFLRKVKEGRTGGAEHLCDVISGTLNVLFRF